MNRERELLARAGLIIAQYRLSDPEDPALQKLSQQINEYFEESAQDEKPIAYWDTQNGTLTPAVPLSSERTCFEVPLVPLYLSPRADIVDELVEALEKNMEFNEAYWKLINFSPSDTGLIKELTDKARAALAKLEEKNK